PGLVVLHVRAYLVRGPAVAVAARPRRLAGHVVGHLVLEEQRLAVLAVPQHRVLLVVLDEQARGQHVGAVDQQAGVAGVDGPAGGGAAVVGAPGPDVDTGDT